MMQRQIFQKFANQSPLTVMVRVMLEAIFPANQFDQLFPKEEEEKLQFRESLFSSIVDLMSLIGQDQPATHTICQTTHNDLKTALNSFYRKVKRIEPNVFAEWVRQTAGRLDPVIHKMGRVLPQSLSGYLVRSVAGVDLSGAHNRPKESSHAKCKTLPYQSSIVLDPNLMLAVDVLLHGKDNARKDYIITPLLDMVQPQDVWMAPPIFNFLSFLTGIEQRLAFFIIRQNKSELLYTPAGRRKMKGRTELGSIFEQKVHLVNGHGNGLLTRRITVELEDRSPDGQLDLHIFTNLPKRFQSLKLADFYYRQWMMEIAFQDLAAALQSEVKAAGYPSAFFFVYCLALIAYNILSVIKAALCAVRSEDNSHEDISWSNLANEIGGAWRGMMIALPSQNWSYTFANFTIRQLTNTLNTLAKNVCLPKFHRPLPNQRKQSPPVKGRHCRLFCPSNAHRR
jgi:hypothetical protein